MKFGPLKRALRMFALSAFMLNVLALPAFATGVDTDSDHIYDDDETLYGFDLNNPDENGNGTIDGEDDYEGDGLITQSELYLYGTNPTSLDTDSDGRGDYNEIFVAPTSDPTDSDSDDDGLGDYAEFVTYGTDPENPDTDGDGLGDYYEEITLTNAGFAASGTLLDTDGDGISDGAEDFDADGISNNDEQLVNHTDPIVADTDADGFTDGEEVAAGMDPLVYDQADMDITDISVDSSTNEILYTAANLGTLDVDYTLEYGYTGVYVDYNEADGSYGDFHYYDWNTEMGAGSWAGTFFNAGAEEEINTGVVLSTGEHTIMVCIERAASYGEMASGFDNCEIRTFSVGLYPDLVIDSVTFNTADSSVSFVVRNAGSADVPVGEIPYLNFYLDYFNSDLSTSGMVSYLIDEHGTDYRTVGGITTVNTGPGPEDGVFPSCTMYLLAVADGNGDVIESDDSNNEYRTSFDLCPEFSVEAGIDQGIGIGNPYNLAAYTLGASELDSATVDWGDGSVLETPSQTLVGDQIDLTASHNYDHTDTFIVTVCANDGAETLCDNLTLSITGSSSGPTMPSSSDTSSTSGSSTSGDTSGNESDQDVTLTGDEEAAADCSAMLFDDVSTEDDFYDAVCELWGTDVIHGKTSNYFGSEDSIRRDEASKMFTRLFGYVTEAYGATPVAQGTFSDVDVTDPLAYYVEVASENDLVTGDTTSTEVDGEVLTEATFNPHDAITAQEIADALKEILGDNTAGEQLDAEGYTSEDSMTRGSFVELLYGLSR